MARKKDYSAIKKVIWRFVRVFIANFLVVFGGSLATIGYHDSVLIGSIAMGATTAALNATAKAIREWVASGDYTNIIHKLPL